MSFIQQAGFFAQTKISQLLDRLSTIKVPKELFMQPPYLKNTLVYEDVLEVEGRHLILLKDGSLGMPWRLIPLQHEVMDIKELEERASKLSKTIAAIEDEGVVVQVMFDSEPAMHIDEPEFISQQHTYTAAQEAVKIRLDMIKNLAFNTDPALATLMSRKVYVFLSVPRPKRLGIESFIASSDPYASLEEEAESLQKHIQKILLIAKNFEDNLLNPVRSTSDLIPLSPSEFIYSVRDVLNSFSYKKNHPDLHWAPYSDKISLNDQCCGENHIKMPSAIEVGECDSWQILSWKQQSAFSNMGMMSALLQIKEPIRFVLNIRSHITEEAKKALELKSFFLQRALSSDRVKQKNEVKNTLDRIAHNEKLVSLSMHVLVRQTQKRLKDLEKSIHIQQLINTLNRELSIVFTHEKWSAPVIFDLCLPFAYHVRSDVFTGREQLVLVESLTDYLPILGGFTGSRERFQLMQSRAGNACYLSTWSSQAPHICIIGGTGGGKSVITANFLTSQLAAYSSSNLFIVDNKTSYTMVAKALAKTPQDYKIFYPPKNFPNLFLGNVLDHERLALIISVIKTAILLCDQTAVISNEHTDILKRAIETAVFHKSAMMDIHKETTQEENVVQGSLTMDEIVQCFPEVCEKEKIHPQEGQYLRSKLRPFLSQGVYGPIFNQEAQDATKNDLCQISIYDMDGVSYDPILRVLTTQICILDIVRIIKSKENMGKKGVFLIDEAGFLLDSANNPELVNFIDEAWKTFRKLNILCMGIANLITDYKNKPACKTIWNVSPNKFILPMNTADVDEARRVDNPSKSETPLFNENDEWIAKSLKKVPEKYSQVYFRSEDCGRGTFIYKPTGCDYWLSVSKKEEIETVELAALQFSSYWEAIKALGKCAPFGFHVVTNGTRSARLITQEELASL